MGIFKDLWKKLRDERGDLGSLNPFSSGPDTPQVYQSPYYQGNDQLAQQQILQGVTGGNVNTPEATSQIVAQQIGGTYDPKAGTIKTKGGSTIRYDPTSGQFTGSGPSATGDLAQANQIYSTQLGANSTKGQLASVQGPQTYNPATGRYESTAGGNNPEQATGDYYLNNYGGYLNNQYSPNTPYQEYGYTSPTIGTTQNVNDAVSKGIYNREADVENKNFAEEQQNTEDSIANAGGSLSGGRAFRLRNDQQQQHGANLDTAAGQVQSDQALRQFYDASHVRDLQAAQDARTQELKAGENQAKYAADTSQNQYGFQAGQQQGAQKLSTAENANNTQQNFAQNELGQERGLNQNNFNNLKSMMDIYLKQQGLDVQNAGQASSASNGLFGTVAGAAGKAASAFI